MPRPPTSPDVPVTLSPAWSLTAPDYVNTIALSPCGGFLAAATASGQPILVHLAERRACAGLPEHDMGTLVCAWSPDGSAIVSAGQDNEVRFHDGVPPWQARATAKTAAWVEHGAWQPGGAIFVAAAGKRLRTWDPRGTTLCEFEPTQNTISGLDWAPDGSLFATAAYRGLSLWNPQRSAPVRVYPWEAALTSIAWSPCQRYIACGCIDNAVRFWDLQLDAMLQMSGYDQKVTCLTWNSTSRWLATANAELITIWDFSGAGPRGTTPLQLGGHLAPVSALAFAPGSERVLATGARDGMVMLRSLPDGDILNIYLAPAPVTALRWAPDASHLYVGYESGLVLALRMPAGLLAPPAAPATSGEPSRTRRLNPPRK